LEVDIKSGGLILTDCTGDNLNAKISNEKTEMKNIDIKNINISNFSSQTSIDMIKFERYDKYNINAQITGGYFDINTISNRNLSYYIKATSLEGIKVNIDRLDYIINSHNDLEARSIYYSLTEKHVDIVVATTEGKIRIN
jgi:hypothetical protein